jgi:hypothetical protein
MVTVNDIDPSTINLFCGCTNKQWGSKYRTYEYPNHLNTEQIEIWYSNSLVFRCPVPENQSSEYGTGFQMFEAFLAAIFL